MRKWHTMLTLSAVVLCLTACGQKESNETKQVGNDSYTRPPTLFLATSDVMIEKVDAQIYQWTYTDRETNVQKQNIADALPPSKIVSIEKPINIKKKRYLAVAFQPMPQFYRIKLLDGQNDRVASYTDVTNIKEHGTYILEVDATFKKGTARYYIPIKLPKK